LLTALGACALGAGFMVHRAHAQDVHEIVISQVNGVIVYTGAPTHFVPGDDVKFKTNLGSFEIQFDNGSPFSSDYFWGRSDGPVQVTTLSNLTPGTHFKYTVTYHIGAAVYVDDPELITDDGPPG